LYVLNYSYIHAYSHIHHTPNSSRPRFRLAVKTIDSPTNHPLTKCIKRPTTTIRVNYACVKITPCGKYFSAPRRTHVRFTPTGSWLYIVYHVILILCQTYITLLPIYVNLRKTVLRNSRCPSSRDSPYVAAHPFVTYIIIIYSIIIPTIL